MRGVRHGAISVQPSARGGSPRQSGDSEESGSEESEGSEESDADSESSDDSEADDASDGSSDSETALLEPPSPGFLGPNALVSGKPSPRSNRSSSSKQSKGNPTHSLHPALHPDSPLRPQIYTGATELNATPYQRLSPLKHARSDRRKPVRPKRSVREDMRHKLAAKNAQFRSYGITLFVWACMAAFLHWCEMPWIITFFVSPPLMAFIFIAHPPFVDLALWLLSGMLQTRTPQTESLPT
jgi:hypothetical protein